MMIYISASIWGHEASAGTLALDIRLHEDAPATRSLIHRTKIDGGIVIEGKSACVIFVQPVTCDITGWVRSKEYHIWLANECVKHVRGDDSVIQVWRDNGIN